MLGGNKWGDEQLERDPDTTNEGLEGRNNRRGEKPCMICE